MVAILAVLAGSALAIVAGAIVVLVWACWSRTPWRELGFVRPPSWIRSVVLGVVFKLLMKSIVMPLFGAPAINPAYHSLAGNTAALPGMLDYLQKKVPKPVGAARSQVPERQSRSTKQPGNSDGPRPAHCRVVQGP